MSTSVGGRQRTMARRKQIKAWVGLHEQVNGVDIDYRKEVTGYTVTIYKIPLVVHPSQGYTGGRDLWNCSDLYTGRKVGPRVLGMERAIQETRRKLKEIEEKHKEDRTLLDLFEEKHMFYGNIMELPEKETT
jgi:hypothetical protein